MLRPVSATHGGVALAGFVSFLLSLVVLSVDRPFANTIHAALFVIAATGLPMYLLDLAWRRVHRRASTGLDFDHDDPSWGRTLLKFAGLLGCLAPLGILYWLFPEYHSPFYQRYWELLRLILPPWLILAMPYFHVVDRHLTNPRDGYWHMGKLVTFQWHVVDGRMVWQLLLGWFVKGFFLPLMFCYFCTDIDAMMAFNFSQPFGAKPVFDFLYSLFYLADVAFGVLGYMVALRLMDTHMRSAEPTPLGWMVALVCYEPFWGLFSRQYFTYDAGISWGSWLWNTQILYTLWGSVVMSLVGIYALSTVVFGPRFSNLTHRGIITSGPYRFTKHPAYVAKCLSYWMISIPFLAPAGPEEALRKSLVLLLVTGLYVLRAKTEEWHLSRDPEYVRYAEWIAAHGMFRFVRHIPLFGNERNVRQRRR